MTALVWNSLTGSLLSHNANMYLIRIVPKVVLEGGRRLFDWQPWHSDLGGRDSVETVQQGHCQGRINMRVLLALLKSVAHSELSQSCPHAHTLGTKAIGWRTAVRQWYAVWMCWGLVSEWNTQHPLLWATWSSGEFPLSKVWQPGGAIAAVSPLTSDSWFMSLLSSHGDKPRQGHHIWDFKCSE